MVIGPGQLFGRQVIVELCASEGGARVFRDLRVTASIEMSRKPEPNKSKVEVYNLGPESIALMQRPGSFVRLLAGYDVPRLLFTGTPAKGGVKYETRGPDKVLSIEALDGGDALQNAQVNVSYRTQTTARQVFDEVARQIGLPQGTIRLPNGDQRYPRGVQISGTARDVMDRLAANNESEWFVRDGVLQFIKANEDTGESAISFSVANGNLIGSPIPKEDGGLEVVGLLEPSVRPGRPFVIQSEQYNGTYIARDVSFVLDTHGTDFYTKATGYPR